MRHIRFCWNASSWNTETDTGLPESMADLITQPILEHLPEGSWSIGRNPVEGAVNCYSSARSAYPDAVWPKDEISVLISHGIADKGIRQKLAPGYDFVATPGPMHTDILRKAGVPEPKIIEVGYTKLDPIFNGDVEGEPIDTRPRILYAPTQGGGGDVLHMHDKTPPKGILATRRSSWWRKNEILRTLKSSAWDVVECWHPRYTPGHKATLHQYVGAQAAICDGGSTLWECMVLGIPVVVPAWITGIGHKAVSTSEGMLYTTRTVRIAAQPRFLHGVLQDATQHGPTQAERDMSYRILTPETRGVSGKLHAEWLMSIA